MIFHCNFCFSNKTVTKDCGHWEPTRNQPLKVKRKLFANIFKSIWQVLIKKSIHLKKIRMVPKHAANQNEALFIINTIYDE